MLEVETDWQLHDAHAGHEPTFSTCNHDTGHVCTQASRCPADCWYCCPAVICLPASQQHAYCFKGSQLQHCTGTVCSHHWRLT